MSEKVINLHEISSLDKQIEQLYQCKPLNESEMKQLCEKVLKKAYFFINNP